MSIFDQPQSSAENQLLLQACLVPTGESALQAWESQIDINHQDQEGFALLPALHHQARQQQWALRDDARIAGVFKYHWTRAMQSIKPLRATLVPLQEAGIEVRLSGGIALALSIYPHMALRPYQQIDIAVRAHQQPKAFRVLTKTGWLAHGYITKPKLAFSSVLSFHHPDHEMNLQLRWSAFDYAPPFDDSWWQSSLPIRQTIPVPSLQTARTWSTMDHFILVAGTSANTVPALRLMDGYWLTQREDFDWGALPERARRVDRAGTVTQLLIHLHNLLQVAIPDGTIAALGVPSWQERWEAKHLQKPHSRWRAHVIRYSRRYPKATLFTHPRHLLGYLRNFYGR